MPYNAAKTCLPLCKMSNSYFQFKQFTIHQQNCAMKVCTDACLFGAWVAEKVDRREITVDSILDIGCGTGLLSLMLAQRSNAVTDAIEIDEMAAEQAVENIDASPWKNRLQVICGDARTVHLGRKYDLIISNPPFFENGLRSNDAKRNIALHGDALSFEELVAAVTKHISPDGIFAVLLPYHRKDDFIRLALKEKYFLEEEVSVRQTPAHPYFRSMLLFGMKGSTPLQTSLTIRENDLYTKAFAVLLEDYYLKL